VPACIHGDEGPATGIESPVATADPRALDTELRRLVTERQRQEAALAAHLRSVGIERWYRFEGFASLEEYASERFGLSSRRLYYLLSLHKTLECLPSLCEAFIEGRLTLKQTLLVGKVAEPATVQGWIRRAASITLRRLEDEVEFWLQLRESRPDAWETLEGGPIPDGVVLVPGRPPRLHASALCRASVPPEAERFIRALEASEEEGDSQTWPERTFRIRMRVEPAIKRMWLATVARCRAAAGSELKEWEALVLAMNAFHATWDNAETRRQRRENPILERDGWRCAAPGCRSMGTGRLQVHHIRFRSAGGSDEPSNLTVQCVGHHLGLLHEGKVRCSGRAPDGLRWELGVIGAEVAGGLEPFLIYEGETRIGGAAV
jgi:hypothetical protein